MTITATKARELTTATINKENELRRLQAEKFIEERLERTIERLANDGKSDLQFHFKVFDAYQVERAVVDTIFAILKENGFEVLINEQLQNIIIKW